jgi:hypothetical protein
MIKMREMVEERLAAGTAAADGPTRPVVRDEPTSASVGAWPCA